MEGFLNARTRLVWNVQVECSGSALAGSWVEKGRNIEAAKCLVVLQQDLRQVYPAPGWWS